MKDYRMFINGEWTTARAGTTRDIINPANSELLARVPEAGPADIDDAVAAARRAFDSGPWRSITALDRGKLLFKLADLIRQKSDYLAELDTLNNGKPLVESKFDVTDAANCFEYYGGLATKIHGESLTVPANSFSFVVKEPIGVVGQIIPWNYPLLMAAWKLAPALAAGNCCVLKPSELTPLSALELAAMIKEAGFPDGVVNIVTGGGSPAGQALTEHPGVDKLVFTGGTVTGRKVMTAACVDLKRVSLELGGKSPNIVFVDADFEAAVDGALFAIFVNSGQVCSAGSRLIIDESIHDRFIQAVVEKTKRIKLGPGIDPETKMGPLVSETQRARVEGYVEIGKKSAAKLLIGGGRPGDKKFEKGFFVEPTIFDNVDNKSEIAQKEIFGPVLCVIPFKSEDEAIAIANDSPYGLAGAVWSTNVTRALRVIKQLRAGITWINTYHPTYNEAPWGGYKQSGFGRELGTYGLEEYLEIKQININLDEAPIAWY
ncbi:MAG: aldehyde dehydrogenase family protein [Acidobacteria bacterium]|nr:aldehyde dehydrogenase family protein [Acidobacteriota bacterium]